jgi:hypothetical protein
MEDQMGGTCNIHGEITNIPTNLVKIYEGKGTFRRLGVDGRIIISSYVKNQKRKIYM